MLDYEDEYELRIGPVFDRFAIHSGFKLLKTNKDMLLEGMLQHHCVGTYINEVNSGSCAIYHVDGYTLQIVTNSSGLTINQFKGKYNEEAPKELYDKVDIMINDFNEIINKDKLINSEVD